MEKLILMWELSLVCNLSCSFCYQKDRRALQRTQLKLEDILKMIDNIDIPNVHIAFIGWESFIFPWFIEILEYLDKKEITYEVTTNGTLIDTYYDRLNQLTRLTNINFSIDFFWRSQDISRNRKGLFDTIIETIPKIKTKVNINTVILKDSNMEEILKLHLFFNGLNVNEHTLLMYSTFSEIDKANTIKKIEGLKIITQWEEFDNISLSQRSLEIFKKVFLVNKNRNLLTKLKFIPEWLLRNTQNDCKHLRNQYRINEKGQLTICHYIDNEFWYLWNHKFSELIEKENYKILKRKVAENFPLDICKNCCKLL